MNLGNWNFKLRNYKSGFTLIELLIVIAIIGILSSVVLSSLSNSRNKAYDAKVKQQLNGFRRAAELYYSNQNPNSYGPSTLTGSCTVAGTIFTDVSTANGNPNAYLIFTGMNPAPTVVCNSNGTAYAVQSNLKVGTNNYWCVDSKNNAVIKTVALGANTVCQ